MVEQNIFFFVCVKEGGGLTSTLMKSIILCYQDSVFKKTNFSQNDQVLTFQRIF